MTHTPSMARSDVALPPDSAAQVEVRDHHNEEEGRHDGELPPPARQGAKYLWKIAILQEPEKGTTKGRVGVECLL